MHVKKLSAALITAAACGLLTAAAFAEISASVGVASTYLWRGYDLGSGTPAVSGGLSFSSAGAYVGTWVSSGDTAAGTEYDVYAGYGVSFGRDDLITIDFSVWNYNYPTGESEIDFGDLTEFVFSLGVGPVAFTLYDNIAGGAGYMYYTLSGSAGKFGATLGMHDNDDGSSPTHLNLDYSYNDNLVFTLSQFIDDEPEGDDLKVVASYSIPIDL